MLRWGFAAVTIVACLLVAAEYSSLPTSGSGRVYVTTLWWCLGAFVATIVIVDRFIHAPTAEGGIWIVFSSATAFAGTLLLLASAHSFYSRVAVAASFVFTTAWLMLGARLLIHSHTLRLGVPEPMVVDLLAQAAGGVASQATRVGAELLQTRDMDLLLDVDGVVIDRYSQKDATLTRMITDLKLNGVRIYSADHVHELLSGRLSLQHIEDSFLDDSAGRVIYEIVKRGLDVAGAISLLIIGIVPMLLMAIAIRVESRGPALFRQNRIGLGGRIFQMVKFRTMQIDASSHDHENIPHATDHQDSRITRIGQLLRRARFDELPQLFNVLNGTMSLIGPRPEWTETAREFYEQIPHYPYRYLVRPGITGWAQVNQGHVTGLNQAMTKLEFDLYYVKNLSFALDLLIGVRTIRTVLTGFGAR